MENLPILLRPATDEDVNFIFNSWLRSFRNSEFAKSIENSIYYANHHGIIQNLVKTYNVTIACNQKDKSQIYGFICSGLTDGIYTVQYLYVKYAFRKLGIANAMLKHTGHNPDIISLYTHKTGASEKLALDRNFVYHPYLMVPNISEDKNEKE